MFVKRGDRVMPSIAVTTARMATKHGIGVYGETLFANVVVDPEKYKTKTIAVYFDADDDGKEGGTLRTLAGTPTWYVDKLIVTSTAAGSAKANGLLARHVNFLCSARREPVFCEEEGIWYMILHVAMIGRPRRPGRSSAGMDIYEAALRVAWRPMSSKDPEYATVTGISVPN